ncbi:MAG: hypothetical protein FWE16_05240 [Firmicutes bacterium]|nr:hypothetical protein [Bacillota bacterium]
MKKVLATVQIFSLAFFFAFFFVGSSVSAAETRFARISDGTIVSTTTERVDFAHRTSTSFNVNPVLPVYQSDLGCGITAGGVIISWYQREFLQLLPGNTPGSFFLGNWRWTNQNIHHNNMFNQLSPLMGAVNGYVTINGYLGGMNSFVSSRGRTFTSTSLRNANGTLNFPATQAALRNGQLVTIFVSGYSLAHINGPQNHSNFDIITVDNRAGYHAMAVFGYQVVRYYNSSMVMFRQDIYLRVHSGHRTLNSLILRHFTGFYSAFVTHVS